MEVFGVPVTAPNIALTIAGLISTWWVSGKLPWRAIGSLLLSMFTPKADSTAVTIDSSADDDDPGDDVMVALRVLHEHAMDAESHKLISAVEADFWQKRAPSSVNTILTTP